MTNHVTITYCTGCKWLLRSAWMAQELLTTFEADLDELSLRPGSGGIFEVQLNGKRIWSRKDAGRFPDIKELKQLVRNEIAPDRSLGHTDGHSNDQPDQG
jgi:selenoprotein W-related protein